MVETVFHFFKKEKADFATVLFSTSRHCPQILGMVK
jgi:hypothetical protein